MTLLVALAIGGVMVSILGGISLLQKRKSPLGLEPATDVQQGKRSSADPQC